MRNTIVLSAALMFAIGANAQTNAYTVTSLVTSSQDPHLMNPWGLAHPSKQQHHNYWWAAD
jgi:hypothetical protein